MKIIEKGKLKEVSEYWIDVLGLKEWDIVFRIQRKSDMTLPDCSGDVNYQFIHKKAIVSLIDPIDWNNDLFEQDMEETLIHELLHLKFAITDDTEEGQNSMPLLSHQLLCDIARSLLKARYSS